MSLSVPSPQNSRRLSWQSLKRKPFPSISSPAADEDGLLLKVNVSVEKELEQNQAKPSRLKRMLSSSKLSRFIVPSPPTLRSDPEISTTQRKRHNSTLSLFGLAHPSPTPSPGEGSSSASTTPDLSPSASSTSSFSSSSSSLSPAQIKLDLPPQIVMLDDLAKPWSMDLASGGKPKMADTVPLLLSTKTEPRLDVPDSEKKMEAIRPEPTKSVWEVSDEEESGGDEKMKFKKREVKQKPILPMLEMPSLQNKQLLVHSQRFSSSSTISSSPPASPLFGARALYNHTCAKLREAAIPAAIHSIPSSASSVSKAKSPTQLYISLHRQSVLRKLGSPFAPGSSLPTHQQKEVWLFVPKGSRPIDKPASPSAIPSIVNFVNPLLNANDSVVSVGIQSKTAVDSPNSPLIVWSQRPTFCKRMFEYLEMAEKREIVPKKRSESLVLSRCIHAHIALRLDHAAMSALPNVRPSHRSFSGKSPSDLPLLRSKIVHRLVPRRAASAPAPTDRNRPQPDDDEVPLAHLLAPKQGAHSSAPASPQKARTTARSMEKGSSSSSVASSTSNRSHSSLPRSSSGTSTKQWVDDASRAEYQRLMSSKRMSMLSEPKNARRKSANISDMASPSLTESRRRSTLLPPAPLVAGNNPPRPDPKERRRSSYFPAQPLLTEIVLPLSASPSTLYSNEFLQQISSPYPPQPTLPSYNSPISRNQSFDTLNQKSIPSSYSSHRLSTSTMPRTWSTPTLV